MSKLFKKTFWVPYEDGSIYPTLSRTMETIYEYCEQNKVNCTFVADDKVIINDIKYEIYRGYEPGSRGNYGIKCTEI